MKWSEEAAPEEEMLEIEEESDQPLYQGDSGKLSLDARRVLVQLLAGPSLDGQRHSKLWPILIRDEMAIRSRSQAGATDACLCSDHRGQHLQQVSLTSERMGSGVVVTVLPEMPWAQTASLGCRSGARRSRTTGRRPVRHGRAHQGRRPGRARPSGCWQFDRHA